MFAGSIDFLVRRYIFTYLINVKCTVVCGTKINFCGNITITSPRYNISPSTIQLVNLIYYYGSPLSYGIPCKLLSTGIKLLNLSYFFIFRYLHFTFVS